MSGDDLRALLRTDGVIHVPGIHDPATAALAIRAGHRALHLSGTAVSALMLGRPDLGFVPATQIADRAATIEPVLGGVPLLADADIGYDDPAYAVWTGLAYARAGISGLHLADRAGRPADRAGRPAGPNGSAAVGVGLAAAKIEALAREVPQLAVIARTDVYAVGGLTATVERCRLFAAAGADAVLAEGVDDPVVLAELHAALPGVPLVVDRSEAGGNRPAASDADLAAAGVRMVLHPTAAVLAALRAAAMTYHAIADHGSAEPVDRLPWAALTELIGPAGAEPDTRPGPGAPVDHSGLRAPEISGRLDT